MERLGLQTVLRTRLSTAAPAVRSLALARAAPAARVVISRRWTSISSARTLSPPFASRLGLETSRRLSTLTPEVVDESRKTSFFYFDSLFPLRYSWFDVRYLWAQFDQESLLDRIRNILPTEAEGAAHTLKIDKVIAREKDGGAFVRFSYMPHAEVDKPVDGAAVKEENAGMAKADLAAVDMEKLIRDRMSKTSQTYKPWYLVGDAKFFLVQGKPWLEDMERWPNAMIRIEFEGPEVPQEQLYDILRPYGRLRNIFPQPPSNKDTPRFADVLFRSTRSAAAARNCLHGYKFGTSEDGSGGTTFRILYKERVKAHAFRDWVSGHPRIVVPIVVALIGGLSYLIFDPIREFMIKSKVEGTFELSKYRSVQWLRSETLDRLGLGSSKKAETGTTGIEQERETAKDTLKKWLRDVPDSFITVTGPRGAGKVEMVKAVTKGQAHVLEIDCETICRNAKGNDDKLVGELASQLGYFPQFGFLASMNNLIDLASVGLIGQKAGFSSPLDVQIKNILNIAGNAFKSIADKVKSTQQRHVMEADERHASKEERAEVINQLARDGMIHDGRIDCVSGSGAISEVGYGIEREKPDDRYIVGPADANRVRKLVADDPPDTDDTEAERLPVVIVKGYATKEGRGRDLLWDSLAEWAAALVQNRVAHVIFVSDNVAISKPLSKALPGKPLNAIAVNDASAENAIDYVAAKLNQLRSADVTNTDIDLSDKRSSDRNAISKLGGRQTDLEILVQKLVAGQGVHDAVGDIVHRSASSLKKNIFADGDAEEQKSLNWTPEQAWYLVKRLSAAEEIPYADALYNGPFKGNDKALHSLEQAEMISVTHGERGAPHDAHRISLRKPACLRPGRPVYAYAFEELAGDKIFAATQELAINSAVAASATTDLKAAEQELISLAAVFDRRGNFIFGGTQSIPLAIAQRQETLLNKMRASEETIERLSADASELKKVLKSQ